MAKRQAHGQPAAGRPAAGRPGREHRPFRSLLVLFLCAGIAGLGLLTGGEPQEARAVRKPDPMARYFPATMPRYPDAQELPMGQSYSVDAGGSRMSHFATKDEPSRVANFYGRFWRARGLWVNDDVTHRGGVVSAVDARRGRVYQIVIDAHTQGATHVFPSVNAIPKKPTGDRSAGSPVVLYKESEVLMNLTTQVGPRQAHTIASVNDGTVDENLQHYRAALASAGCKQDLSNEPIVQQAAPGQRPYVLVCRNEMGAELTVNIGALDNERTRVHIMAVGE